MPKGVMPSCSSASDVYSRGFSGLNDGLPGPTNRAILLANLLNRTQTTVVQDAAKGGAPLWMVADKLAGYDAVPYLTSTVPEGGRIALPAFAVALVFLDNQGCGTCNRSATNGSHPSPQAAPLGPGATPSARLDLVDPSSWVNFRSSLGPPCIAGASCPQYNPQCDCQAPHCTEMCGAGGPTTRCCTRNGSSLWSGVPHIHTTATAARPLQGANGKTHITGLSLSFRYISGSCKIVMLSRFVCCPSRLPWKASLLQTRMLWSAQTSACGLSARVGRITRQVAVPVIRPASCRRLHRPQWQHFGRASTSQISLSVGRTHPQTPYRAAPHFLAT